jgi:hypothetical protein
MHRTATDCIRRGHGITRASAEGSRGQGQDPSKFWEGFLNDAVLKDIPRVLKNRLTVPEDNVEVERRRATMTSMSSD